MAQSAWTDPGSGSTTVGFSVRIALRRPPNNRIASAVFTVYDEQSMNPEDWQYLLDGLAKIPGMATATLREGAVCERQLEPDVPYEPLPVVNDA
jgi:hypothetical protein